jgi:TPR repeat protein
MSRAGARARCVSTLVMLFVAVAVAPRACAAANAWKAAENKLRQDGLLVNDAGLPDDGESAAAVEAEPAERVGPAEEKFRAARAILSEFTARHRRNARAVGLLRDALALDPNHREAMTLLGRAYQMGEGVEPDGALAMEHFRRAADLGDPGAHFELGFAYSVGWVRPRNARERPPRGCRLPARPVALRRNQSVSVSSPARSTFRNPTL